MAMGLESRLQPAGRTKSSGFGFERPPISRQKLEFTHKTIALEAAVVFLQPGENLGGNGEIGFDALRQILAILINEIL
jgi:hypothetical protein